ncbi:hypothetical protein HGRIS_010126 [Hohenbuehelia grisea]|uniref:Autophagy-related protein 29 n=1 Tax=Hohenbuehelia grisea TaxID=104357 RepID=A0ABR3J3V2_9AGAR
MPTPSVRVVVKLPWDRPEQPVPDPPQIEWTAEKADILWKVIELSRSSDNATTDWKGLAAHLEVPLPYLLYRVHTRFEEDLRGLKDIREVLSPPSVVATKSAEESPRAARPSLAGRMTSRMTGSSRNPSTRLSTPLGIRQRLNSLGANSPHPRKATSSSTLTLQGARKSHIPMRPTSASSSEEESDSEDEDARKEEEADRNMEEEEALARKLKDLQLMMTNDALGLVSASRPRNHKGNDVDRGRPGLASPPPTQASSMGNSLSSANQSLSSAANSVHGSIPDIPTPPSQSQSQSQSSSPMGRHMSPAKSSSPPAVSPRSAIGQSHRRFGPLVDRSSEPGSSHGSEASSFSDISDASLSPSALESALLSNIRGNGSRMSAFARSRFSGRSTGFPH